MEISELQEIIKKSGLSVYRIEKDLSIPNGTLSQVISGKKKLPEKYEAPLRTRCLVPAPPDKFKETVPDKPDIHAPSLKIEKVAEPVEKKVKKPDMEYANFL